MLQDVFQFFLLIISKTIIDLFKLFGSIIIFGFILYLLASLTRRTFAKTLGSKTELYITGWIGTPIHELSHAFFCWIFNHKIKDIKLFTTKSDTIGYVLHSYDIRSWYQQMGNFFIGVAPILMGTFVLYVLFLLLTPELKDNLFVIENDVYEFSFSHIVDSIYNMFASTIHISENIFYNIINNSSFKSVGFWIFLYLSISVASHMELSPADISHAWKGVFFIIIIALIFNTILLLLKVLFNISIPISVIASINKMLETYNLLLIFATIISSFNFLLSYVLLTPISIIRKKRIINPFTMK